MHSNTFVSEKPRILAGQLSHYTMPFKDLLLGKGGFGTVRVCTDIKTNKNYACKVIKKKYHNKKIRNDIFHEVHMLLKLKNSNRKKKKFKHLGKNHEIS